MPSTHAIRTSVRPPVLERFLHENRGFFPLRQEDCCAAGEMDNSFSTGMEEIALLDREVL